MAKSSLLLLSSFWMGLIFGLSFIEAPLKFQAPGITTELGLGIGKLLFNVVNKIEIGFALLLMVLAAQLLTKRNYILLTSIIILLSILLIQSLYLLPYLNEQTALLLAGQDVASSSHHLFFIVLEVLKLPTLLFIFYKTYRL